MSNISVESLHTHLIKSCAPSDLEQAVVTEYGIEHDREWMLIGGKGQPITQRTHPQLALVQPYIRRYEGEDYLHINAPKVGEIALEMELDPETPVVPVNLWRKPGAGRDMGPDAAEYFEEYLGKKGIRLLHLETPREIDPRVQVPGASNHTGFADGSTITLASQESLADLNEHIREYLDAHPDVQFPYPAVMAQFRPNIVVSGGEPYAEDRWREIIVGSMRAYLFDNIRCPMPNVDLKTGILPPPKDRVVTIILRALRNGMVPQLEDSGEIFMQNLVHVYEPGTVLKRGDTLSVIRQADGFKWQPVESGTNG